MKLSKMMLRTVCALGLALALSIAPVVPAHSETINTVPMYFESQRIIFEGQEPVIINGRTLAPIELFDIIGIDEIWLCDDGTTAFIYDRMGEITAKAGELFFIINGERFYPDVLQQLINGQLMLPLRAIVDALIWGHEPPLAHPLGLEMENLVMILTVAGEYPFWWDNESGEIHLWYWEFRPFMPFV